MIQILYKKGLYIRGDFSEILSRLREIGNRFKTVKDYIDYKSKGIE